RCGSTLNGTSPPMDSTILTPRSPSSPSSTSPNSSPPSASGPAGMPLPSSPDAPNPVRPQLVPHGGNGTVLGATVTAEGVNFAVYSETATALYVSLYDELDKEIDRFELDGHDDNIHHGLMAGIGAGAKYGFRADGPYDPGKGLHFDPNKL